VAANRARVVNRILQRVQSQPDLRQQLRAVHRQFDEPALPSKQRQAEILFERLNLHACGAHGNTQRCGGTRKMQVLGHGDKYAKTA
jgi:hypothetical protein